MCCQTGLCGPSVDQQLIDVREDLRWAEAQGADVARHNLSSDPDAFVAGPKITGRMTALGESALPVLVIDGAVTVHGRYPSATSRRSPRLRRATRRGQERHDHDQGQCPAGLQIERIDPAAETARYSNEVLQTATGPDADGRALLERTCDLPAPPPVGPTELRGLMAAHAHSESTAGV